MYVPKHFEQRDPHKLLELIRTYPLATVVVHTKDGLLANHIPLVIADTPSDRLVLHGHIARANPLSEVDGVSGGLAVFHGPNAYISPNWYATKQQHGKVVPTWNYSTVHAAGDLRIIDDRDWTLSMIERLTDQEERRQQSPWKVADAPAAFTEALLPSIVGLELVVSDLHGKWKVSQNQPEENRSGVQRGLQSSTSRDANHLSGHDV